MKIKNRFDIFHNKVLLLIVLILLLEPNYFENIEALDNVYNLGAFITCILLVIITIRFNCMYKSMIWILSYFGFILFTTLLNNPSNIALYIRSNFSALAMCMVFSLWMNRNPEILLESFSIFELYIYINLLTIILSPNTQSYYATTWFLGYKNFHIRTILPVVCISMIRSYMHAGRLTIRTVLLLITSFVTFILNDSATSLVGFTTFLGFLFFFHKKDTALPKFINLKIILIMYGISCIVIVINQNISQFSFFIETLLERNLTLTSRTKIWNLTLKLLNHHLIIGYGYLGPSNFRKLYSKVYNHPHNYLLYQLMIGGILLLIILLIGYIFADNNLKNSTNKIYGKIVLFCLSAFLIMGITESLTSTILLNPMLILAMEADKLSLLAYRKQNRIIKLNIVKR